MQPTPISDKQREQVLALARAGQSRNAIARQTGVSATSVSRIVKAAGLNFEANVPRTELATATRAAQQRAERVDQAQGLLDDLRDGRARLAAAEKTRDWFDTARGIQALALAHARLAEVEHRTAKPEDSAAESRSLLGDLMSGLREWRAVNDRDDKTEHPHDPDQDDDQEVTE